MPAPCCNQSARGTRSLLAYKICFTLATFIC
jgi:hypothetical protein